MNELELVKYKKKLIDALNVLNRICKDYNIKYFASGGTAIGAIRHKGFIPWDDDIDVCMLREDYNRFIQLKDQVFDGHYKIMDYSEEGYCVPSAKFVDCNTALWEVPNHPIMMGAYIDVFPLDFVEGSLDDIQILASKYRSAWNNYSRSLPYRHIPVIAHYLKRGNLRTALKRIGDFVYYQFFKQQLFKKFKEIEAEVLTKKGDRVLMYNTFYPIRREIIRLEAVEKTISMPFEDTTIQMPVGYDEYLSNLFGDYMKLPPEEKRVTHHSHVYLNMDNYVSLIEARRQNDLKF